MQNLSIERVENGWSVLADEAGGRDGFVFVFTTSDALADFVADWARGQVEQELDDAV